ncbi:LOW QUALITY PROTEIN: bifunctional non-homologous end joining protein LigD [Chryseobacterium defluvii]|uniref:DNA ligase (ATP) n=2 Tax=Chryseobacterium defluvii TaxID=160396 RepID=A0A495SMG2_9FLAO|nr:LOW QUALITY PROTEIN: bifunctional non-homologous end joining protein LigD [Chryseobacterium defluvii]
MALKDYQKKRKFDETAEPKGKTKKSKDKLIFVIQRHAASRLHYDFRLEMEGVLKSWAVPKGPSLDPKDKRLAMMVEDHPYDYKDFEGNIPEGNYGAGQVEIWDSGTYEPLEESSSLSDEKELLKELHAGSLKFILHGKKLKGEFALVKMKNSEDNAWLLIKHKDEFAESPYDVEENTSPKSLVEIFRGKKKPENKQKEVITSSKKFQRFNSLTDEKKLKDFIRPMLAKSFDKAFDKKDWVFEIKWDGYRAIADLSNDSPLFYSRNGISFLSKFQKVSRDFESQKHKMIIDGEIVAYDDQGKPSFQLLQQIGDNPDLALVYQVFDLLWLNGHSTENLPLLQRKELLKEALVETDIIKYCDHIPEKGIEFFEQMKKMKLEGMIAKKADSLYIENHRTTDWLKIKFSDTDEAIICGFTEPRGSRKNFGALILGKYIGGELTYCGHTGTGFNSTTLAEMYQRLEKLIIKKSPFETIPKTNMPVTWVQPELVCEIKYSEITKDGIFRHPVFVAIREDKEPEEVRNSPEEIQNTPPKIKEMKTSSSKKIKSSEKEKEVTLNQHKVKLTNQDKMYFPKDELTKGDVIEYYQSVAEYILPHLKNRPLSLNRFPNGIEEQSFYQKDASDNIPDWIKTTPVHSESNDKYIDYIICNDKATMAYLNNLGCIDFNPWNSSLPDLENPDFLVLDLDPSKKNTFDDVIETALQVKEVLDSVKIKGYCKTSGSTGIHIYIPMGGKYDFDQVKDFAHLLMQQVQEKLPDITTLERNLKKRDEGKIYLDYLQNRTGQTLASVYSLRPKEGASVSMPLEWDELKPGLKPTDFNIHNALERVKEKGDLFKPVLGKGIDMMKALELLQNLK